MSFVYCLQLPIGPPYVPPPTRYVKSMIFQHTLCKISYFEIHLEVVVLWTANHNLFFSHKKCMIRFSVFFKHEIPLSMSMTYSFFSHLVKALNVSCAVDDGSHSASLKTLQVSCCLSCRKWEWKIQYSLGLMLPIM